MLASPVLQAEIPISARYDSYQERQQEILHWSQPNRLAVQYHRLLERVHEQVFITIKGRQSRFEPMLILHGLLFHQLALAQRTIGMKQKPR
jgi:hypothetical protein